MNLLKKALFASALFAAASAAHAQTFYSTGFDGFSTNGSLAGQFGWATNDPENPADQGESYQIGNLNQVVNGTDSFNGSPAGQLLGGVAGGSYADASPVYLYHTFDQSLASQAPAITANGGYTFNTDFVVSSSSNTFNSTYAFTFQTTAGGTNLFSINLTPDAGAPANTQAQLGYTVGGISTVESADAVTLNGVYHLTVNVSTTGEVTASYYGLSQPGTVALIASFDAGAAAVLLVDDVAVTQISPGALTTDTAAQDSITFDNFSIAVPEPSTYAMMGLGLLALVGTMKFRRRLA